MVRGSRKTVWGDRQTIFSTRKTIESNRVGFFEKGGGGTRVGPVPSISNFGYFGLFVYLVISFIIGLVVVDLVFIGGCVGC